jgi:hypothetical protein
MILTSNFFKVNQLITMIYEATRSHPLTLFAFTHNPKNVLKK